MNRRSFMQMLVAAAAAPAIGLPAIAPAAPAIAFTNAELVKIAQAFFGDEECLIELEEKEPFRNLFVHYGKGRYLHYSIIPAGTMMAYDEKGGVVPYKDLQAGARK